MALATPKPKPPPSKIALAAAGQASMRAPQESEMNLTPAQRAKRGVKLGLNDPPDQATRRYTPRKGGGGVWTNTNGTAVGQSSQEDTPIMPGKSTGDMPPPTQPSRRVVPFPKGK